MPNAKPEFTCSVAVRPLPENAQEGEHAYAYTVTIKNSGNIAAQLIARHWIITDALGRVQEVRGLAVVGQQPYLQPGEEFEYSSWTQLVTAQGSMRGTFLCVTERGDVFHAPVPEFLLGMASSLH